jgi:hypothetical protein
MYNKFQKDQQIKKITQTELLIRRGDIATSPRANEDDYMDKTYLKKLRQT